MGQISPRPLQQRDDQRAIVGHLQTMRAVRQSAKLARRLMSITLVAVCWGALYPTTFDARAKGSLAEGNPTRCRTRGLYSSGHSNGRVPQEFRARLLPTPGLERFAPTNRSGRRLRGAPSPASPTATGAADVRPVARAAQVAHPARVALVAPDGSRAAGRRSCGVRSGSARCFAGPLRACLCGFLTEHRGSAEGRDV